MDGIKLVSSLEAFSKADIASKGGAADKGISAFEDALVQLSGDFRA
jgi:hypothetical protein